MLTISALIMLLPCLVQAQDNQNDVQRIVDRIQGEPDWDTISKDIAADFKHAKFDSITLLVKVEYYWKYKKYEEYMKHFIPFVEQYNRRINNRNSVAWRVFQYAKEKEDLAIALTWAVEALNSDYNNPYYMDTYANLLYKSGNLRKAIEWQTQAVWLSKLDADLISSLIKMKIGLPTWKYPLTAQKELISKETSDVALAVRNELSRKLDSAIWQAQLNVLKSAKDSAGYTKTLFRYADEFRPLRNALHLNEDAWSVLLYSKDPAALERALVWSSESINDQKFKNMHFAFMDTYANLLYKLLRKNEAIAWEEKALSLCPESEKISYKATLTKMKNGERTR